MAVSRSNPSGHVGRIAYSASMLYVLVIAGGCALLPSFDGTRW